MLPGDLGRNSGLLKFGWQFRDKYATHERLGKLFVQVTPTCNVLHVGDPEICEEVMRRWEDFPKPRQIYRGLLWDLELELKPANNASRAY